MRFIKQSLIALLLLVLPRATVRATHLLPFTTALPAGMTADAQSQQLLIPRAFVRKGDGANFTIPMPASRLH